MNIIINWDSSVTSAPLPIQTEFMTDVSQVASFYDSVIQNPITVTIDVGYGEINGSKIGGAALGESETNLQQVTQLTSIYPNTDPNFPSSPPKGNYYVSDAEAQALGIQLTNPPAVDGYIGFSSKSGIFDYTDNINSTLGTSGGSLSNSKQYDFEGTVAHEISEVLGRIFLGGKSYSAYDLFSHYSNGVHDFSAKGGGYFSNDGGNTPLGSFNTAHGGDGADWGAGGTGTIVGGSTNDAFNAFGSPGQITPVSYTDLAVLQALGYTLNDPYKTDAAEAVPLSSGLAQTTVQNTGGSGSSQGLDHAVALFTQSAAGFSDQTQNGALNTNPLSQTLMNQDQFLANPHHG